MNQKQFSVLLKIIISVAAAAALFAFVFVAPTLVRLILGEAYACLFTVVYCFVCISAVPVFVSLLLVWLICSEIERDNSFCRKNVLRLRNISLLALSDSVYYIIGIIASLIIGVHSLNFLIVLIVIISMGIALSAACAIMAHLTEKAAAIKDENDLTV